MYSYVCHGVARPVNTVAMGKQQCTQFASFSYIRRCQQYKKDNKQPQYSVFTQLYTVRITAGPPNKIFGTKDTFIYPTAAKSTFPHVSSTNYNAANSRRTQACVTSI